MMQHDSQTIDDLVHMPELDLQLDIHTYGLRFLQFMRRKWFKSKKLLRVPGRLKTQYSLYQVILFIEGSGTSLYTDHRNISINPDNDAKDTTFPDNRIVTKKYTLWNFIPKNLFEQFRRIANFYFLLMAITSLLIVSPISPLTSIIPLSFVVLITACKQGYEDYQRHVSDQRVNQASVTVIRNKCVQSINCEQIVVGDLVKVCREQDIPCDLLLLFSTEESDRCYVTTSNLDGESNLKTIMVPKVITNMTMQQIVSMEATITCQHPSSDLYSFHGLLQLNDTNREVTSSHLTIDNLLLRGSRLKDTDHIIGCAVYTGHDTKLSLNSKIKNNKFSTAERSINKHIVVFVVLLLVEVILSCIMKNIIDNSMHWDVYLGPHEKTSSNTLITDFLSFTILYNYTVPISLYVTIELQKFLSSFFFSWDTDIYDDKNERPALANSSDLNEELGQIEYLFTDKTGTLTENLMVFRRCSINGNMYMEKDCDGKLHRLPANGDENMAVQLTSWESNIWHFMISISLCHAVQISPPSIRESIIARRREFRESFRLKKVLQVNSSLLMDPDLPEYQAASADEKALVEATARCGVVFWKSTSDQMEIKIGNKILVYEKLEVLEFTSERKRMSVLLKDAAGDFWLYCKGADSSVLPLVVSGKINEAIAHVADFSTRGFRTLVVAYKKLNKIEYDRLIHRIERARQIIGLERGAYIERAYNLMESGLTLLGVTAVEDRLQEGVQETLECLQVAGIKVWVLTGDKAETAENIALLCGQFKSGTEILRMIGITVEEVCLHRLTDLERTIKLEPHKQYGLLVDGSSISVALSHCPEQFRSIGMACDAVVCCRLTPLQKSEVVNLMKRGKSQPHTAAIGDGGNDVAMIQEAHVGIGIMGKEGRQATMSADFAIANFRFLQKIILVHGRWYYVRISTLTQYFFYKNFVLITPQLLFNIFCGFSAQTFYDAPFLMLFNLLFASLPILVYGLFEQDYSADKLLRRPYLYRMYQRNYLLSGKQFLVWTGLGCWHALVVYFMPYLYIYLNPITMRNHTPMEHWSFSTCVFHLVTLVVNLEVLVRSSYWTVPFIATLVFSEVSFVCVALFYSTMHQRYEGDMLMVTQMLMSSLSFWILTIIVVIVCLIPDVLVVTYDSYRPDRVLRRNEELPYSIHTLSNRDSTEDLATQSRSQRLSNMIPRRESLGTSKAE